MAIFLRLQAPAHIFVQIIGCAMAGIAPGNWVLEHSIAFHSVDRDYGFGIKARDPAPVTQPTTLQGFRPVAGALHWGQFALAFCYSVALSFGVMASRTGDKEP